MCGIAAAAATFKNKLGDGRDASFYVVATAGSRKPGNKMVLNEVNNGETIDSYLTSQGGSFKDRQKLHLISAGPKDTYYIVGASEAPYKGFMAFADGALTGWVNAEPYKPEAPEAKGQWKFEKYSGADAPDAYHIVSTSTSSKPNEMLYIGSDGTVGVWGYDATETNALWTVEPAPPSPPNDYAKVLADYEQGQLTQTIISMAILAVLSTLFLGCYLKSRRARMEMRVGASSSVQMGQPVAMAQPVVVQAVPMAQGVPMAQATPA